MVRVGNQIELSGKSITLLFFLVFFALTTTTFMIVSLHTERGSTQPSVKSKPQDEPKVEIGLPVITNTKIKGANPALKSFPDMKFLASQIKKANLSESDFESEGPKLQAFVNKVLTTKEPIFPMTKNSSAIIISCKLDTVCVTNIVYTLEFINSDLPIGLLYSTFILPHPPSPPTTLLCVNRIMA